MEKLRRTIFFWTLVILFIITAPVVVMRARGYRFDLKRGVFVHSGTITIKSNPQDMDLTLNGKLIESKTLSRINSSYNISGLMPGEYSVKISAQDFQDWNKKIEVHSGVSSELWNVLLVRKNYDKKEYDSSGIDNFFLSPKDDYAVFYSVTETGTEVKILDLKKNSIENDIFLEGWEIVEKARKENIEWSPQEDYLLIPVRKKILLDAKNKISGPEESFEYSYFILDPANDNFFNLNSFLGLTEIRDARWDPKEKGFIFFQKNEDLYRASVTDASYLNLIANPVSAYELSENGVYFSQSPSQLVYRASLDGKAEKVQITNSFPQDNPKGISRLIVYDEKRIVFINSDKELFVYNSGDAGTYFKKLSDSVESVQFSNDGKKLLYWSPNEISVYFLRDWDVQPVRSENEIQNITRYSAEIENVQWLKDYEHVLFSVGPQIKIIELDARDHRNLMDLPTVSSNEPNIIYSNSLENLFFTDKNSDGNNHLYSIVFPEKIGILGF